MTCKNCGIILTDGTFCNNCGTENNVIEKTPNKKKESQKLVKKYIYLLLTTAYYE